MANPIDPNRIPRPVVPGLAAEREAMLHIIGKAVFASVEVICRKSKTAALPKP